jgi:hypothetical protein
LSDPQGARRDDKWKEDYEYTSLLALDPFGQPIPGEPDYHKLDSILKPAETFVVFETSDLAGSGITQDHTHSRNWINGWTQSPR